MRTGDVTDGIVPFHKLSQWLAFSLFAPLEAAALTIERPDELTALAEYRNGGLLIDLGVIRPHATFGASSLSLDQNAFSHDLGGGLNLFLVHKVGLHGEVRHLRTFKDVTLGVFSNDKLDFWRASAGLTFRF